ncbi:MAG: Ca-activated chloride channel [Mycobacterium sp.]|nr:Ca-activated chloride channel [Mycobacterium sp.]
MTFHAVLPPLLLAALAAAIVLARVLVLHRNRGTGRTRTALWRWVGLTSAALLLLCAAARPVLGPDVPDVTRVADDNAPNVFLVVDRSPDMGIDESGDGRSPISEARADIVALIDRYPGARVAVIAFASRPSLDWPLSADTWSLRPVMSALTPYASAPDATAQANVGAAANVLRYQLFGAMQQYPRAKNQVFYLGAGALELDRPPSEFDLPEGSVDGGAVLGYGPAAASLRSVAAQIGVPYLSRDGRAPLADALPADPPGAAGPPLAAQVPEQAELYWAFALGAAALLLVELYLVLREFRRTRMASADVIV